ncbi:MAG: phosphatidate cytidylyltransferase, partial [Desulfuromonadales bacterium]
MVLRKATGRAVIKQRIITAVIALPILVLCVFYASQGLFSGLLFVISALALREFYRMALPGERRLEGSLSIVAGIFCCLGIVYAASPSAILLSIVLPFLLLTLVYLFRCQDMQKVSRDLAVSLFGILYIPVLLAHAV